MDASIKLGRIWGIPIGLHYSWFLIFGLVTWSLAAGLFPEEYPNLPTTAYWLLGLLTSALFFGSVLVHELGHALLALRYKVNVTGINLFLFGGVAQLSEEPPSPRAAFWIAVAGPLASLGLAALFGALWFLDQNIAYLAAPSIWLARINFLLAAFNLIPGFPLDGGQILRALVWQATGNYYRATQVASFTGQLVAFGFMGVGIFTMVTGSFFNGLWLIFIGWFLQNAAAASYAHSHAQQTLRGVTVAQAMSREVAKVPGLKPISQLVEEQVLTGGRRSFIVSDNGHAEGMLTLTDISAQPQRKWPFLTSRQVMVPLDKLITVEPQTELMIALQRMDEANVAQLPVIEAGQVVGMLSREEVLHYLRLRAALGV